MLAGRPVYFDVGRAVAAFRENLIPQASLRISDVGIDLPGRALLAGARDEVISCNPREGCSIPGNGISVSINSARAAPTPGEIQLSVTVVHISDDQLHWTRAFAAEFFLTRAEQGPGWKVVRKGPFIVS